MLACRSMENENDKQEILEAIHDLSTHMDGKMQELRIEFKSELKSEITSVKSEIATIKSTMVTKSYLDDKMADLRGDLVGMVRKEDVKVDAFVNVALGDGAIKKKSAQKILAMGPFPKL